MIDQECANGFTAKLGGVKVAHTVRTGKLIAAGQPANGASQQIKVARTCSPPVEDLEESLLQYVNLTRANRGGRAALHFLDS